MGARDAGSPHVFGRSVPATAENIAPVRRGVLQLAIEAGAGEQTRSDIAVAVGEACANVVVHAYPPGDVGALVVDAEWTTASSASG